MKSRLNSKCYYLPVHNLSFSSLLSKNIRIEIYITTVSSVILYEYKTWALSFKLVHILRVIESRLLRKLYGTKWNEATAELRNSTTVISIIFTPHYILFWWSSQEKWVVGSKWHVRERGDVCMGVLLGNERENGHLEKLIIYVRIILNVASRNRVRGRDWFHLAEDRDKWRVVFSSVMNLWFPWITRISFTIKGLVVLSTTLFNWFTYLIRAVGIIRIATVTTQSWQLYTDLLAY